MDSKAYLDESEKQKLFLNARAMNCQNKGPEMQQKVDLKDEKNPKQDLFFTEWRWLYFSIRSTVHSLYFIEIVTCPINFSWWKESSGWRMLDYGTRQNRISRLHPWAAAKWPRSSVSVIHCFLSLKKECTAHVSTSIKCRGWSVYRFSKFDQVYPWSGRNSVLWVHLVEFSELISGSFSAFNRSSNRSWALFSGEKEAVIAQPF